ncbi:MAG: glycosyltransferase family 4 protein [Geminicoccaceae bacterium]|nr:glycosyltransferase family 4 protein [Geminicoccaceae bacterium]
MRLEPVRVALLTNNLLPPGEGVARHVVEVAKRLQARGFEPLIVARGEGSFGWRREGCEGVPVLRYPHLPVKPFHHALSRLPLQRWLDDGAEGADLVHVHLPLLPPLRTRLRRVVTVHSPMLTDAAAIGEGGVQPALLKLNARIFSRRLEQHHLNGAETVVAVSEGVADELAANYALKAPPRVIPNGVDTHSLRPGPRAKRANGPLLYVGRLGYRKGLFRLLEAVALLGPGAPVLELAGAGPLGEALRARARLLGIRDRVRFLGFLDRGALLDRLHAAACLVNPADYESGPLTLLEGMATATPIVTTRTGLVREIEGLSGGRPPFVAASSQPASLADAIEGVLADPHAADERAILGRRLVERHFDWESVADRLVESYGWAQRKAA